MRDEKRENRSALLGHRTYLWLLIKHKIHGLSFLTLNLQIPPRHLHSTIFVFKGDVDNKKARSGYGGLSVCALFYCRLLSRCLPRENPKTPYK